MSNSGKVYWGENKGCDQVPDVSSITRWLSFFSLQKKPASGAADWQNFSVSHFLIWTSASRPSGAQVGISWHIYNRSMWLLEKTQECLGPLFSFDYIVFGLGKRKLSSNYPISFLNLHRLMMGSLHKQSPFSTFPRLDSSPFWSLFYLLLCKPWHRNFPFTALPSFP